MPRRGGPSSPPGGLHRRAPLCFGAAGLRQLLRPRLDRSVRVIEAELAVAGLVGDDDDTDMAAALEPTEQNLVGKSVQPFGRVVWLPVRKWLA
jgi:hypothetical protein